MTALYVGMIIIGVVAVVWGLSGAHRLRKPFDILAALAVLAGVIVALLGVLLTVVPGFFEGYTLFGFGFTVSVNKPATHNRQLKTVNRKRFLN